MIRLQLAAVVLFCAMPAWAHKPSDSFLKIESSGGHLSAEWDIAVKDLEFLIGLDSDQDGKVTWGELRAQQQAIQSHALSHLQIVADGHTREIDVIDLLVNQHSDGAYATLRLQIDGPADVAQLEVRYSLLFRDDPTHRGLVSFQKGAAVSTHVLAPDSPQVVLDTNQVNAWRSFREYFREGVWHIWIGVDHILFLLTLLLPAVWQRTEQKWEIVDKFRPACWNVLKVVTMFTLAHSITLWLAVMGYVQLPSWIIESAIAFSIVVTSVNNMIPLLRLSSWGIAFGFGLIHGFGFANVLVDLGLTHSALGIALLAFNVGVECGQLAIVLALFPCLYWLRGTNFYRWVVFTGGSVVVSVIALLWMYERMFNAELIPL